MVIGHVVPIQPSNDPGPAGGEDALGRASSRSHVHHGSGNYIVEDLPRDEW